MPSKPRPGNTCVPAISAAAPLAGCETVHEWPVGITVEVHGVRIGVRVSSPDLWEQVCPRLPHGWRMSDALDVVEQFTFESRILVESDRDSLPYRLYDRSGELVRARQLDETLDLLEFHLQLVVAEQAEDRVFVHAGVVGWEGRAIVLPGRSYAGKTTLVQELLRLGAVYYSDEFAVLDGGGLVHPFTRPLAIRTVNARQHKHTVESLGGIAATEPVPIGLVVLTEYRRYARWRPRALTPGHGLLELLNHAVPARRKPELVLETLERVMEGAPVLQSARCDARRTAPRMLRLLNC